MAIPDGVLKLTFSGDIATGAEKWAFSLYFTGYTGINDGSATPYDGATEPTSTEYVAFRTAMCSGMVTSDHFTAIDAYYYQGGVAVQHGGVTFSHAGTSGTSPNAAQVACVMTLRTSLATRSGRGRIFLPCGGAAIDATRHFVSTYPNTTCDALAVWLGSLFSPVDPVVVSQKLGATHVITSVDCDLVPDTQRRRRNKLTGPRHSHVVLP